MLTFVFKMNLVQIREMNKAILLMKLIDMLLCAYVIVGEVSISTFCILMTGFMQITLCRVGYNRICYIVPKNNEIIKRFLVSNCRICTAIDVMFVLFTAILINLLSGGAWDQELYTRMFMVICFIHSCLYVAYFPAGNGDVGGIKAACYLFSSVILAFVCMIGNHCNRELNIYWIIVGIASIILAEHSIKVSEDCISFGDYDEDMKKFISRRKYQ